MEIDKFKKPIILDTGSYSIKIGFAGEEQPRAEILNLYGFPKYRNWGIPDLDHPIVHPFPIGKDAIEYKDEVGYFNLRYPKDYRRIGDFSGMKQMWKKIFEEKLKISPQEHPFLILEHPLNPTSIKEEIASIFFTEFKAPKIAITDPESLALIATGRRNGVIIDCGYQISSICPIYMGFPLIHAYEKYRVGFAKVRSLFLKYFRLREDFMFIGETSRENNHLLEHLLRNYLYFSHIPDIHKELFKKVDADEVIQRDGKEIKLGDERFLAPEVYFHPEIMVYEGYPLPKVIIQVIENCDEELKAELYQNIMLSGGGSCIKRFEERLDLELKKITEADFEILAPPNRQNISWLGGSKILDKYENCVTWCNKADFEENGEQAIHKSHINIADAENFS